MLYLPRECLVNFASNLYITPYLLYFVSQKQVESRHFYSCPPDKILPGFYFHLLPPGRGKLLLPLPEAVFFRKSVIPLSRKGEQETKKVP